ncbi:hypothetical protein GEMRC1_012331 [Eukaryota sp. GEM-RC1]
MGRLENFYSVHLTTFTILGILGSFLIYFSEKEWDFVDSFFMSFSSITDTGLTTTSLESAKFSTRILVLFLLQLGSPVLWTLVPVVIRRHFLINNFNHPVCTASKYPEEDPSAPPIHLNPIPLYKYSKEYWAMSRLIVVVLAYTLFLYLFGFLCLSLRFALSPHARYVADQVGGWKFFTIFHVISASTNCGMSLFSSSLTPFRDDPFILIPLMILIVFGQTGFPVFLRLIIINRSKTSRYRPVYTFLLHHGRSVYTHLFSTVETSWLAFWWLIFFLFNLELF